MPVRRLRSPNPQQLQHKSTLLLVGNQDAEFGHAGETQGRCSNRAPSKCCLEISCAEPMDLQARGIEIALVARSAWLHPDR